VVTHHQQIDLLPKFVFEEREHPFSAYLKLEDGKVGFEFPEKTTPAKESKQENVPAAS